MVTTTQYTHTHTGRHCANCFHSTEDRRKLNKVFNFLFSFFSLWQIFVFELSTDLLRVRWAAAAAAAAYCDIQIQENLSFKSLHQLIAGGSSGLVCERCLFSSHRNCASFALIHFLLLFFYVPFFHLLRILKPEQDKHKPPMPYIILCFSLSLCMHVCVCYYSSFFVCFLKLCMRLFTIIIRIHLRIARETSSPSSNVFYNGFITFKRRWFNQWCT